MAFQPQPLFQDSITQGVLSALNSTLTLILTNSSGAIVNVSGTWVGTILFEGSNDDFITFQNAAVFTPPAGVITTGVTSNGYYRFVAVSGFTQIRARMSIYTSGSANIVLSASIGAGLAPTVSINYDSMLGTSKIAGGTDSTKIGNTADRLKVDAQITGVLSGASNTISKKLRTDMLIQDMTFTNSIYITLYTYSGSGLFVGAQFIFDNDHAQIKLTIDSDVIFDTDFHVLKTFDLSPSGPLTSGLGGLFYATDGSTLNFIPTYPIPYSSLVKFECKSSDGGSHKHKQQLVVLTKET